MKVCTKASGVRVEAAERRAFMYSMILRIGSALCVAVGILSLVQIYIIHTREPYSRVEKRIDKVLQKLLK